MSELLIQDTSLQSIADAIRGKNGQTTLYTPAQMVEAITALATGGVNLGSYIPEYWTRSYHSPVTSYYMDNRYNKATHFIFLCMLPKEEIAALLTPSAEEIHTFMGIGIRLDSSLMAVTFNNGGTNNAAILAQSTLLSSGGGRISFTGVNCQAGTYHNIFIPLA